MRAAHARIQPFEEADPSFDSEDVEWACAEGLARLGQVIRAIQNLTPGHCRIAVEGATERAGALLLGGGIRHVLEPNGPGYIEHRASYEIGLEWAVRLIVRSTSDVGNEEE